MALVWEHEFPYNQQLIMLSLADHANDRGEKIFPSIARQAWKTGYSERQVGRILKELRDVGILIIVKKAYRGRPTEYKIDWSKAKKKEKFRYANLDTLSENGVTSEDSSKDISKNKGDIAMSDKPSLIKPSLNEPSENKRFTNNIKKAMVSALSQVTGMDESLNYGRLAKDAKALHKAGYSATDISNVFGKKSVWYKKHWKGRKGDKPTTGDIRSLIKELVHTEHCGCDACRRRYVEGEFSEFIES